MAEFLTRGFSVRPCLAQDFFSNLLDGWTRLLRRRDFFGLVNKSPRSISAFVLVAFAASSIFTWPWPSSARGTPLLSGAKIDPRVRWALERSCRDCHSDATRYPWYSYVPPVSWLIASDIRGGRKHLNFSRWSEYSFVRQERALSEIANQVKDGEMPLFSYLLIHRDARLSEADAEAIFQWTQAERIRLIEENLPPEGH